MTAALRWGGRAVTLLRAGSDLFWKDDSGYFVGSWLGSTGKRHRTELSPKRRRGWGPFETGRPQVGCSLEPMPRAPLQPPGPGLSLGVSDCSLYLHLIFLFVLWSRLSLISSIFASLLPSVVFLAFAWMYFPVFFLASRCALRLLMPLDQNLSRALFANSVWTSIQQTEFGCILVVWVRPSGETAMGYLVLRHCEVLSKARPPQ